MGYFGYMTSYRSNSPSLLKDANGNFWNLTTQELYELKDLTENER